MFDAILYRYYKWLMDKKFKKFKKNLKNVNRRNNMNTPKWNDSDWISLSEMKPVNGKEVYLKCEYMFTHYITKGSMSGHGKYRESSDVDPDLFFRSKIIAWKPIKEY